MLVIRQGMFDTMAISFDSSRRCLYVPNPTSVRLFIMSNVYTGSAIKSLVRSVFRVLRYKDVIFLAITIAIYHSILEVLLALLHNSSTILPDLE